jgi:thioesterase domain-containing protein
LAVFAGDLLTHAGRAENAREVLAAARKAGGPQVRAVLQELTRIGALSGSAAGEAARLFELTHALAAAGRRHHPERYSGPTALIRASASQAAGPSLGWSGLIEELTVEVLPGDHFSLLSPERAPALAQAIAAQIERALRGRP